MRFTGLNQLLNEPQLKHVQANENSVVSEPLQRACCRQRNISDSTQKRRPGLSGGLWKGTSAQLQIARKHTKWQKNGSSFEAFHPTWTRVGSQCRAFHRPDTRRVSRQPSDACHSSWIELNCLTAGITILSNSLEYQIMILFCWVIKSDLTWWLLFL